MLTIKCDGKKNKKAAQ